MFGSYYPGLPYAGQSDGLVFGVDLVVADALHGHTADNILLAQQHLLVVADALHGHLADGDLALIESKLLAVQEALHAHTADNILLVQQHSLAISDALHDHMADNLDLFQAHALAVQDALHGQFADEAFVSISDNIFAADGLHAHTADNITILVHMKLTPPGPGIERPDPNIDSARRRTEVDVHRLKGNVVTLYRRPKIKVSRQAPKIAIRP